MESGTTAGGGDASWPPGDPPPFQLPRPPTPSRRQIKEAYFPVNTNQKLQHPEIQYAWTAEDDEMVEQIKIWRQRYVKVIVPKNAHDAGTLGHWLSDMRRRKSRGQLDIDSIRKLEEAGVEWKVSVLDAKWFSNFHAARECKEAIQEEDTSSSLEEVLTPEYSNQNRPDWVEASRWLERQRQLYRRQKLTDMKVYLLKRVLGIKLKRQRGPRRGNLHPRILEENAAFEQFLKQEHAASQEMTDG